MSSQIDVTVSKSSGMYEMYSYVMVKMVVRDEEWSFMSSVIIQSTSESESQYPLFSALYAFSYPL